MCMSEIINCMNIIDILKKLKIRILNVGGNELLWVFHKDFVVFVDIFDGLEKNTMNCLGKIGEWNLLWTGFSELVGRCSSIVS